MNLPQIKTLSDAARVGIPLFDLFVLLKYNDKVKITLNTEVLSLTVSYYKESFMTVIFMIMTRSKPFEKEGEARHKFLNQGMSITSTRKNIINAFTRNIKFLETLAGRSK